MTPPLPCLCLAGPTASGKTAAALAIAEALRSRRPVEIVSVDSALVYRGMDIGTAKPGPEERVRVPHHLIDLIEPSDSYSAARFVADARRLIDAITARGHLPLLAGGTMLYFKALFDGLDDMPPSDPAVRSALDAQATAEGWHALHAELARVDPSTAARLPASDAQRIQRALEVYRISRRPLSSFHTRSAEASAPPPPLISLEPQERGWLHARIAERFSRMLDAGLVDEVRRLRARGDLHARLPAMRCVGYRQTWEMLDERLDPGIDAPPSSGQLSRLAERGIAATRQLAKRQLTWLRGMPQRHVVAADAPGAMKAVVDEALRRVDAMESTAAPPPSDRPSHA